MKKTGVPQKEQIQITPSLLYLLFYNFAQALGWTFMALRMGLAWADKDTYTGFYDQAATLLNIFQTLALLEIVHAAVGLVKSNPVLTGFQIMSRVLVTWGIGYSVPEVQKEVGMALLLVAWSLTEIIRYSYYMCALVNNIPYLLMWCRYTFFIVLYPIGVTGELLSIYGALPYVQERQLYTLSMPNIANFGFSYYHVLIAIMLTYIPIFPQLYLHMFAQRGKMIGGSQHKKAD